MKKEIKVTIAKTTPYTPLQKDIMTSGAEKIDDEELKEKMRECQPKEIVIDPDVAKFFEDNGISLDDFIKEFKERSGLDSDESR